MERCSAIVLAGGKASRLGGSDKAALEVGGKPIFQRVLDALRPVADQIVVVGHLAQALDTPGVERADDVMAGGGTLVAIYSGLLAARNDVALVVGCDMPFLATSLLRRIAELSEGHDVAVPRVGSHLEALHAVYRRTCLPVMADAVRRGQLKIIDFYPQVAVRVVEEQELRAYDPDLSSFFNVNTPADLQRARSLAAGTGSHRLQEHAMPPIVSVVGRSDAGKTTFLEKLIPELKSRGVRVAVVKHDRHGFEMDRPGKDTWRLREAGADAVMISAPNQMALIRSHLKEELGLDEMAGLVGNVVDLVLTEGYKSGTKPKIEVSRRAVAEGELLCTAEELLAVVADGPRPVEVPQFGLDDAAAVAELLVRYLKEYR